MPLVHRVLDERACLDLEDYVERGGGLGLDAARRLGADGVIDEVDAAGLRGRGGAGFPTGKKWRTIAGSESPTARTSVVVNGAEGEPGTFKDRALLRCNPYKVIEGALIAALAVDAGEVILCLKHSFERELQRVAEAIAQIERAGWAPHARLRVVEGPSSYLFGEETALLEVVEGRQPFPRVDPPFRRGLDAKHVDSGHSAARVHLAGLGGTDAAPALVNNVETMANVPGILRHGADWYRSVGTVGTPGTLICTFTGHTHRHGVGEVEAGTTLRSALDLIGGGSRSGRSILGVLSGVANPVIPFDLLDTPLCFDEMARAGLGLGSAGFIVFQDHTDMLEVAHNVARFLAIESCGQCEPCKRDGLAITSYLGRLDTDQGTALDVRGLRSRLDTVTRGARCALAGQQERVIGSILSLFGPQPPTERPLSGDAPPHILPLVDIVGGRAILDTSHEGKQSDWTHDERDSGSWPAAHLGNLPVLLEPPLIREELDPDRMDPLAVSPRRHDPVPFPGVTNLHRELEELLDEVLVAEPTAQPALLRELRSRLRSHTDVTRRVLFPMVRRVAGDDGETASRAAEDPELAGLRLLRNLVNAASDDGDDRLERVAENLRSHIVAEQQQVIPLLLDHLDADDLDALVRALNEARARVQPELPT